MTRQYCSVCKEWLDMDIVPTGEGEDDDGVAWYRCPQCQGFLPKLKSARDDAEAADPDAAGPGAAEIVTTGSATSPTSDDDTPSTGPESEPAGATPTASGALTDLDATDPLPWDSPADMAADRRRQAAERGDKEAGAPAAAETFDEDLAADAPDLDEGAEKDDLDEDTADSPPASTEPLHEYAALLAEKDPLTAVPYRPWQTYELQQCVHHLAWDDCGVVVGKESLPGGRRVIKVYFEEAGVVRLIEGSDS